MHRIARVFQTDAFVKGLCKEGSVRRARYEELGKKDSVRRTRYEEHGKRNSVRRKRYEELI